MSEILKLSKNSIIYSIENISIKGLNFLLIPVYTRYLSTNDYGIVGLMLITSGLLTEIFVMGQNASIVRFYYDEKVKNIREYYGNVFLLLMVVGLLIFSLTVLLGSKFNSSIFKDLSFYPYVFLAIIIALFESLYKVRMSLFIAQEKAKQYVINSLSKFILRVIFVLALIVALELGAYGQLLGIALSALVFWLISIKFFIVNSKFKIDKKILYQTLKFGLPIIPFALGSYIFNIGDRYLIQFYLSNSDLGVYTLAYNISSLLFFLGMGFNKALGPLYYKQIESDYGANILIPKIFKYFFFFSIVSTFLLIVFSKEIIFIMADKSYWSSHILVMPIALGILFQVLNYFPIQNLFYYKKTKLLPFISIFSAIINILLNIYFIPKFGLLGASYTTLISCVIMFILTLYLSQKLKSLNYNLSTISLVILFTAAILFINQYLIQVDIDEIISFKSFIIKIFISIAYIVFIVVIYFNKTDIQEIKNIIFKKKIN